MEVTKNVYTVSDLVKKIVAKTQMTQKDTRYTLDALREVIVETFADVDEATDIEIKLMQGISFTGTYVPEHEGRNPQTGEAVTVPGKKRIASKISVAFKNEINA